MRSSIVRSDVLLDPRAPLVAVGFADLEKLRADDSQQPFRPREDIAQILNLGKELEELRDDLVLLEAGQAMQPQVQDGLRLDL